MIKNKLYEVVKWAFKQESLFPSASTKCK
jgi:hypothetical protein